MHLTMNLLRLVVTVLAAAATGMPTCKPGFSLGGGVLNQSIVTTAQAAAWCAANPKCGGWTAQQACNSTSAFQVLFKDHYGAVRPFARAGWSSWLPGPPPPPPPVLVNTREGELRCFAVAKGQNRSTNACLGVPYAAPPVGANRWRPPQPVTAYPGGKRNASTHVKHCIQGNQDGPSGWHGGTSEDCLYLDVYFPAAKSPDGNGWPVVVWMHGGAYSIGGAPDGTTDVQLMGNIVFVAVQYRMNVYGFLGSDQLRSRDPTRGSTGNYGLQDQREALKWVRQNAQAFGGNPGRVTIDGCSAGGGSTANHMVNPRSWPYFDQAAGESGVMAKWDVNPMGWAEQFYAALLLASHCDKGRGGIGKSASPSRVAVSSARDASASVDCLLNLTATQLSTAALTATSLALKNTTYSCFGLPYAPVIDGVEIADEPHALAAKGQWFKGPVLMGTARGESCGTDGFSHTMGERDFIEFVNTSYTSAGADPATLVKLYDNYSNTSYGSKWFWAAASLDADFAMHCPTRYAAQVFSRPDRSFFFTSSLSTADTSSISSSSSSGGGPSSSLPSASATSPPPPPIVWLYSYNVTETTRVRGCVSHCTELAGIVLGAPPNPADPVGKVLDMMIHYWLSFYRTGDPNTEKIDGAAHWPRYTNQANDSIAFATEVNGGVAVEHDYRQRQCDYWGTLRGYPL